jgi:Flp pilus assembly protein TadD
VAAPPGLASESFSSKPVQELDARVVMADIHLHSPDYQEKAKTEFEEILKEDPGNAGTLRGLGYAYLRKQDFDHAREYFAKAVERDAKDPWVLYYSAMLFRQDNGEGFGERNAGAVIMQNWLEKAVELNPEFADAYSLLGFAFIMQGKQEEALKAMVKAVNLNPQNVGYRFNVANLYLQMRKFDRAMAVLKALQTSSDPEAVSHAQYALQAVGEAKQAEAEMKAEPARASAFLPEGQPSSSPQRVVVPAPPGSINFAKGKILGVDCSMKPAAVLQLLVGSKTWKLHVGDTGHVVVIGADEFSCSWANQRVAVNYRDTAEGTGEVVSVEIQ